MHQQTRRSSTLANPFAHYTHMRRSRECGQLGRRNGTKINHLFSAAPPKHFPPASLESPRHHRPYNECWRFHAHDFSHPCPPYGCSVFEGIQIKAKSVLTPYQVRSQRRHATDLVRSCVLLVIFEIRANYPKWPNKMQYSSTAGSAT